MHFSWQAQHKRHLAEMFGAQGADFLRGVAFWRIKSSAMPRCFFVTGAPFRMTWTNFFVAGAVL